MTKTSSAQRGNYYKRKTKLYYESLGYYVAYMEYYRTIFKPGKNIMTKNDILGADLIAVNDTETLLINSVLGKANVARERKKFEQYPSGGLKRLIVIWKERAKQPEVIEV